MGFRISGGVLPIGRFNLRSVATTSYSLSSTTTSLNEGQQVTITLTTTGLSNGATVPYTITGISSSDINNTSLSGNFTISNNTASRTFTITADAATEGNEVMTLALDGGLGQIQVTIIDTSTNPTYALTSNFDSVNEGGSVIFTLTTTNVSNGTSIPYTITGVSTSDINGASLTGNFTINSNVGTRTFNITADATTEGNEVMTLSLNNGQAQKQITINDTSLTPTYNLTSSFPAIDEGSSVVITLTTTNVADGTTLPYTITGITSNDLASGSLTGSFTVSDGTASRTVVLSNDFVAEGAETLVLSLNNGLASVAVTVNDTSNAPTYALSSSALTVNEGAVVTITLTTGGVSNGTLVPYTITGVSSADLSGASLTGNFTISNNVGTQVFTVANDLLVEGSETATLTLNINSTNVSVIINDTSRSIYDHLSLHIAGDEDISGTSVTSLATGSVTTVGTATYSGSTVKFRERALSLNDGTFTVSQATLSFTPNNVWTIQGWFRLTTNNVYNRLLTGTGLNVYTDEVGRLEVFSGSAAIDINDSSVAMTLNAWIYLAIVSDGSSLRLFRNGTLVGTAAGTPEVLPNSILIGGFYQNPFIGQIEDLAIFNGIALYTTSFSVPTTRFAKAYELYRAGATVTEGNSTTFTLNTRGVADNTDVPYTISGVSASDVSSLTGTATIVSNTASIVVPVLNDNVADPAETLVLKLDGIPTVSTLTVNDGPTYTLSRSAASVNEGGSFTITLTTTGVPNGTTVPYTISGVSSADINNASLTGNFTISSNSATLTVNVTGDLTLEGTETFTLSLNNGLPNTSISVTINDTSVPASGDNWWAWNNTTLNNTAIVAPTSSQLETTAELPADINWSSWNNTAKSNTTVNTSNNAQLITTAELPADINWSSWNNTAKSNTTVNTSNSAIEIQ